MKVLVFSTRPYDRTYLDAANTAAGHVLEYTETGLDRHTAALAHGCDAVCVFVNDRLDAETLQALKTAGVRAVALRCAGFNNVDIPAAERLGITVVRVPAYSPHAVAEHTIALILTLNRKTHRAYNRVREGNFSLDGLMGFDLHGRTAGVVGTGRIGSIVAELLQAFGCRVFAVDRSPSPELAEKGIRYVPLNTLLTESDIVTLHCPLTPETHHIINSAALQSMKQGAMLINTGRGALIDTKAVIEALKHGRLGYLGLDVYEQESDLFFRDLSNTVLQDDVFGRLLTFPNVLITGHQAFFTEDALRSIAETTAANLTLVETGQPCGNTVTSALLR
jgi:D-lactate dehydrogenase